MTSDYADGGEPTPTRNLRRLRKQTVESNAADAKEHVAADVKDSDTEGCYLIKNWITLFRGCHPMLRAVWFGVH